MYQNKKKTNYIRPPVQNKKKVKVSELKRIGLSRFATPNFVIAEFQVQMVVGGEEEKEESFNTNRKSLLDLGIFFELISPVGFYRITQYEIGFQI